MNTDSLLRFSIHGVLVFTVILFVYSPVSAADQVDINVGGTGYIEDTIRVCSPIELQMSIASDFIIGGMSLGFKIWSEDGASWEFLDYDGYGPSEAVIVIPGSRLYPPETVFEMTGLLVDEFNIDGSGDDSIMVGGVGTAGMPSGPLQHMLTLHMTVIDQEPGAIKTICFDSCFIPPSGAFVFVDLYGGAVPPATLWPEGGLCLPVGWPRCYPPQWDPDLPTELVIDGCPLNEITLSATDPEADDIVFGVMEVIGGGGTAIMDDHGDGTCDVSYAPVPEDVGQEITISMIASDYCLGYPCNPTHDIAVTIVSYPPLAIDCGASNTLAAIDNLFTKDDISGSGGSCMGYAYSKVSGPGSVDPATGVYTLFPDPMDMGPLTIEVKVSLDGQEVIGSFLVDVVSEECCPGDANSSGNVDVSDAVYMINYVFKGGPAPMVMNWGDCNADCAVNVGDIVYEVNYIFTFGPEPQLGCVN